MEIYIAKEGNESGPYTADQVETLHRAGMLHPNDLIWHQGMEDWTSVHRFLGLRPPVPQVPAHGIAGSGDPRAGASHERVRGSDKGIKMRSGWEVFVPIVFTFGFYIFYLLPRQSWEVAVVTGKKRLNPWLVGFLMVITLGVFGAIYQIFLAWSFQTISQEKKIPGRNASMGTGVTMFTLGSFIVMYSSKEFAFVMSAILGLIPFWLIQKEINAYLAVGDSR